MKRLFRVVCFASNDATLSCGCDVEVLHDGYCPSQPNSIKCCPGSTKESDHEACDDDVEAGFSNFCFKIFDLKISWLNISYILK